MLFPMSTLVGLGRGCRLRLSEAWGGLTILNRTDSLTHRDCGNQDMVTIAELYLNRIELYTARLSGYKYSTVVIDCNSGVWVFLLRTFCPNISCPISGIQPFFASLQSDLEQLAALPGDGWRLLNNDGSMYHLLYCIEKPIGSHFSVARIVVSANSGATIRPPNDVDRIAVNINSYFCCDSAAWRGLWIFRLMLDKFASGDFRWECCVKMILCICKRCWINSRELCCLPHTLVCVVNLLAA